MHGPQTPILVDVPVDPPEGIAPTIDDLDIEYWIRPSIADRRVIDLRSVRRYFNRYPQDHCLLPFCCTILFEDQSNRQGVNRTLQQMGISSTWKGNLVIMKNPTNESYLDMESQDEEVVVELVRQ